MLAPVQLHVALADLVVFLCVEFLFPEGLCMMMMKANVLEPLFPCWSCLHGHLFV